MQTHASTKALTTKLSEMRLLETNAKVRRHMHTDWMHEMSSEQSPAKDKISSERRSHLWLRMAS